MWRCHRLRCCDVIVFANVSVEPHRYLRSRLPDGNKKQDKDRKNAREDMVALLQRDGRCLFLVRGGRNCSALHSAWVGAYCTMTTADADNATSHSWVRKAGSAPQRRPRRHRQSLLTWCSTSMVNLGAVGLLLAPSGATAFFAPSPPFHAPSMTTAGRGGVELHCTTREVRTSTTWGQRARDHCHRGCPSSPSHRNVNFGNFAVGGKRRNRNQRYSWASLGMVLGSGGGEGGQGGLGGVNVAGGRGYGMPKEASVELIRLELAEVPVSVRCYAVVWKLFIASQQCDPTDM